MKPTQKDKRWSTKRINIWDHYVPEPNTGCWLWLGKANKRDQCGYVQYGKKSVRVPRVAWMLTHGPIPDGLYVCHKCDVPLCINPGHLFLGTHQDNMRDMAKKGRQKFQRRPDTTPKGERHWSRRYPHLRPTGERNGSKTKPDMVRKGEGHGMHKLTDGDVRIIRYMYRKGDPTRNREVLANMFQISVANVGFIVNRKRWRHVQ